MRNPERERSFKNQLELHTTSIETLKSDLDTDGRAKIRAADKSRAKEAMSLCLKKRDTVRSAGETLTRFTTIV
jgi:hypothetical protein